MSAPCRIFLIAGEPSGDLLGGRLMAALKEQAVAAGLDISFTGVGGPRMEAEGMASLFPMSDLSVFGLAEILPKLGLIMRRLKETAAAIRTQQPDLVVTIDAPDFSFRIAKRLKGSGIPFVHYVAPTVWAWRAGRAKKIQPLYRHLLALLPFEPPYFERVGLPSTFVGHPLVEAGMDKADPARLRAKLGLAPDQKMVVMLVGSRQSELSFSLDVFGKVAQELAARHKDVRFVMPVVPHHLAQIQARVAAWNLPHPPLLLTSDTDKYDAFVGAEAALAVSGTVALELGLCKTPAVIAYKIHPLTALLYRRLIKTPFANLVNLMAGREAVPEYLQERCTPEALTAAMDKLLSDPAARAAQQETLAQVKGWLSPPPPASPAQMAAETVLRVFSDSQKA